MIRPARPEWAAVAREVEPRYLLDITVDENAHCHALLIRPDHYEADEWRTALTAFFSGQTTEAMLGRWWVSLGADGNLDIGGRATSHGALQLPELTPATRRPYPKLQNRRRFFEALGLDWAGIYFADMRVWGPWVILQRIGQQPRLFPVPSTFQQYVTRNGDDAA